MMMREQAKRQHLSDFLEEVRKTCLRVALENYVGHQKRIIQDRQIKDKPHYCGVLGVRMAKVWGVTRGTANRRLQSLAEHGIERAARYGYSHCDRYFAPEHLALQYIRDAIEHWKQVGYSQDEFHDEIKEGTPNADLDAQQLMAELGPASETIDTWPAWKQALVASRSGGKPE